MCVLVSLILSIGMLLVNFCCLNHSCWMIPVFSLDNNFHVGKLVSKKIARDPLQDRVKSWRDLVTCKTKLIVLNHFTHSQFRSSFTYYRKVHLQIHFIFRFPILFFAWIRPQQFKWIFCVVEICVNSSFARSITGSHNDVSRDPLRDRDPLDHNTACDDSKPSYCTISLRCFKSFNIM